MEGLHEDLFLIAGANYSKNLKRLLIKEKDMIFGAALVL